MRISQKLTVLKVLLNQPWVLVQIGIACLPFSIFLTGLAVLWTTMLVWHRQWRQFLRQPLTWGFCGVGLGMIFSTLLAGDRTTSALGLFNFLPFFAAFPALSAVICTSARLQRLMWLLVLSSLPVVLLGMGQIGFQWAGQVPGFGLHNLSLIAGGSPLGRMDSIFDNANRLANYAGVMLILSVGLSLAVFDSWRRAPSRQHLVSGFLLGLAILGNSIALLLTYSRSAWGVAFVAGVAFSIYRNWYWLLGGIVMVATSLNWAAFGMSPSRDWLRAVIPAYFWARLSDELYPERVTAITRLAQWQFTGELIQQRSWSGWGLRSFPSLYEAATGLWLGHPHNLFLMLAAETGVPTTLVFCALVGWIVARGLSQLQSPPRQLSNALIQPAERRAIATQKLLLFSALLAFLSCALFSCFDVQLFDARINLLGWTILSAIWGQVGTSPKQPEAIGPS